MALVGWLLVAGFVSFLVGASRWRVRYEEPMERSLPVMHRDRGRLRWIHGWMIPALFLTTSGMGGLAWLAEGTGAAAAFGAYTVGAVLWAGSLLFRLSVGEWAAEKAVTDGAVPEIYAPFAKLAGLGHAAHMLSAYVTAIPLGWSLAAGGLIPDALAWAGSVWGVVLAGLFLAPRTRYVAAPPFWAHTFTLAVGITLLL